MTERKLKPADTICMAVVVLLIVYLSVYAVLSLKGEYGICGKGLGGYRLYRWQPYGFKHGRQTYLLYVFLPVYYFDAKVIHREQERFVPVKD